MYQLEYSNKSDNMILNKDGYGILALKLNGLNDQSLPVLCALSGDSDNGYNLLSKNKKFVKSRMNELSTFFPDNHYKLVRVTLLDS